MEQVLGTTLHFRIPALVCINKADIHAAGAEQIETYCQDHGIEIVGHIPFDPVVTEAVVYGQPVTAYAPAAPSSLAMRDIWQRVAVCLNGATQP